METTIINPRTPQAHAVYFLEIGATTHKIAEIAAKTIPSNMICGANDLIDAVKAEVAEDHSERPSAKTGKGKRERMEKMKLKSLFFA